MDIITFLGTGDSLGVPRVYCECNVCQEARTIGTNRRYRSSILLETNDGEILVDCGPDWLLQMEWLKKRELTSVLITHAHHDHIGGLPEWADACRYLKKKGMVYAPEEVLETIQSQYPWLKRSLIFTKIDQGFVFKDWIIQPWKVNHGRNGYSYAYRFSKGSFHWAYVSDAINLSAEEKQPLQNLDLLILGTNFYKEDERLEIRSVYDMVEAMELVREIKAKQVFLTHMSHGVDLNERYPLLSNIQLAKQGLKLNLMV